MKKLNLGFVTNLLRFLSIILLFSSFTYMTHADTQHSMWAALQDFTFHKLNFWQRAALTLGASGAGYTMVRRYHRRHYGGGLGCLGVLGAILLGILIIALLPVILVVALVMLICGMPFPRFRDRYYRNDRYERRHRHRRH